MIKSWLVSVFILLLFVIVYVTDLFTILASDAIKYLAIVLVAAALIAARIILGSPLKRDNENEEDDN